MVMNGKSIINKILVFSVILIIFTQNFYSYVKAEAAATVVMTYEDKVFAKQLYDVDVENIKSGIKTDGIRSIGSLCENLTFQTNGEVTVDKEMVMDYVYNAIRNGQTSISIDLKKYTPEELAKASAFNAQNLVTTVNETAVTNSLVDAYNEALLNSTLMSLGINCKIAEASTKFRPNEDRAVNVRNAASKIDGMILQPGQGMSANLSFQPRTTANGYGLGNVISGGTYVKAVGGGICQVSSTLNLAVLRAGIIPTERHNHSHRSSYIGSGLDATISSGTLDYQFVNTLSFPIYISAKTDGGVITVSIYSNAAALGGVVYEPVVEGGKLSNKTYLIGKLNGVDISKRYCYSSKYSQ